MLFYGILKSICNWNIYLNKNLRFYILLYYLMLDGM